MTLSDYPQLLTDAGINVKVLDGYDQPHTYGLAPYRWRTGQPVLSMWHHTASAGYTPNRDKANMWAGLLSEETGRLYQSGGGTPTIVIANLHPAPISSGYGQKHIIDQAKLDVPNDDLATGPDDTDPRYAANRDAWNTEVVLDGIGTVIDEDVWAMLIDAAVILHDLMEWTVHRAIGHAQFTGRKIDLRDGRYPTARETMCAFREAMKETTMADIYPTWVAGWVKGLAEDPAKTRQEFTRLNQAGILEPANNPPTVDYWIDMLDDPYNPAWAGFYARTELSVWGR